MVFGGFVSRLSYPRPPVFDGAGVPWLLTGKHQRDAPSKQDDGDIRAPTLSGWCCHCRHVVVSWVIRYMCYLPTSLSALNACRVVRSTREVVALVYSSSPSSRPTPQASVASPHRLVHLLLHNLRLIGNCLHIVLHVFTLSQFV